MRYFVLFCFLFSSLSWASDPFFAQKDYRLLEDAWVFSPVKAKEVRDRLIDLDNELKLNESLSKSIELYKKNEEIQNNKVNLLLEQNDRLAKSLGSERTLNNWERFGFLTLGIVLTVLAGFAIKKAGE